MAAQLWGWLGQGDDPLEGKALAERLLCDMLGLDGLRHVAPMAFDEKSLRLSRLNRGAQTELATRFGPDGFTVDPLERAALSLGQSYPDQLARRAGRISDPVDAVVSPPDSDGALELLSMAARLGFCVTPSGGATNVTGGFASADIRPRVAASMRRMNRLLDLNETDMTTEAEAGMMLAELEAILNLRGYGLGHFPQSYHGVTLGGAVAAHGSGQRSNGYGRMADMVLSARLATPRGIWSTEMHRHSASGPWLGGLVAGSEGLLGLITSVRLRIRKKPQVIDDRGWLAPSFEAAMNAARALVQCGAGLSMIRISDEIETDFLGRFRLAMKGLNAPAALERLALQFKRAPDRGALVIAGFEGDSGRRADVMAEAQSEMRKHGAVSLGGSPGASWRKSRYDLPFLRESLLLRGIGVDTFETVAPWSRLAELKAAVGQAFDRAMSGSISGDTRGVLMCHLSHSYPEAACLYFTALFAQSDDPLSQWKKIKTEISQAIGAHGGAASHHHGVGSDHAAMARSEKDSIGLDVLRSLKHTLDPENILVTGMSRLLG
ncbi:MAG: FAD-binding oxidoreductase [Rhizobiaceae bacterium]